MGLKERGKQIKTKGLIILGHRGCRNASVPENTMAAFQRAFDVGAEGIEIDVESTKDGQLLVVNRWFLKKNFDFFPWERNLDDIQSQGRERGIWFPLFDEVCQFVKERPGWIFNVEIKSSHRFLCRTAQKAVRRIVDFGIGDQVIVSSFDVNTLWTVKVFQPQLETAYLFRKEDRVVNLDHKKSFRYRLNGMINRSGIKALIARADTLHPEITLFHKTQKIFWQRNPLLAKKPVNTWSVDTADTFDKALVNGVDIIISDNPGAMVAYRSGRSQPSET
jgi:glycerophosphoryl diester phosphodiesterase